MTHLSTRHCLVAASVIAATLASPAGAQLQGKGALAPSTGAPSGSTPGSTAGSPAAAGADCAAAKAGNRNAKLRIEAGRRSAGFMAGAGVTLERDRLADVPAHP